MNEYEVTIVGSTMVVVEAENEDEARELALGKVWPGDLDCNVDFLSLTKENIEQDDNVLEGYEHVPEDVMGVESLTTRGHRIGMMRELPWRWQNVVQDECTEIENFPGVMEQVKSLEDNDHLTIILGESTYSVTLFKDVLDILSGLNGNEEIKAWNGKDTLLFIQIDDDWLVLSPYIEDKDDEY